MKHTDAITLYISTFSVFMPQTSKVVVYKYTHAAVL